jgi:lactate dehydrogenase-like 2-hydroxyacid dehydrogenase
MLRGGVCGILGFGNVGVATARLMRAFGMKIHAINRRGASDEPTDWIATADRLDEMLRVADVLVISAALTVRRTIRRAVGHSVVNTCGVLCRIAGASFSAKPRGT